MRNRKSLGWGELIFGILFIGLGIYSFIRPSAALTGVTLFYGILALITGVVDIAFYVKMEQRTGFGPVLSLVSGILSAVAGLVILFNLSAGAWVIAVLFPIWFIAHCISRLTQISCVRFARGNGYYYFALISNILGIILGFLMIFNPVFSVLSISYLIGIYLLLLGVDSVIFSLNLIRD